MTADFSAGSPARRVVVIATAIGAIMGAVLTTTNVANVTEPIWPATRGFVVTKVSETTKETKESLKEANTRQISIEIRIEDGARRSIKSKIDDLKLELEKHPGAPESFRRLIRQQIESQEEEMKGKEDIIGNLRSLQKQMQK